MDTSLNLILEVSDEPPTPPYTPSQEDRSHQFSFFKDIAAGLSEMAEPHSSPRPSCPQHLTPLDLRNPPGKRRRTSKFSPSATRIRRRRAELDHSLAYELDDLYENDSPMCSSPSSKMSRTAQIIDQYEGKWEELASLANLKLKADTPDPYALCLRAAAALHTHNIEQAIQDCTRALEIDNFCLLAYSIRGQALFALGEHGQATRDFSDLVELAPSAQAHTH